MQHENNKNTLCKYFILIRKYLNNLKTSIDKDKVNKRVNRSTVTRMRGIPVSDLTQYTIHVCLHTLSGSQLKHVAARKKKEEKKQKKNIYSLSESKIILRRFFGGGDFSFTTFILKVPPNMLPENIEFKPP